MSDDLHRFVFVATHPKHEGVASFVFLGFNVEAARRRAIVTALAYFKDDGFETYGPVVVQRNATDAEIDTVVEAMVVSGLSHFTREEAFRDS